MPIEATLAWADRLPRFRRVAARLPVVFERYRKKKVIATSGKSESRSKIVGDAPVKQVMVRVRAPAE